MLLRDHILVGKVWSQAATDFVSHRHLVEALAATRFALLGEVHDNADAHALQGWAIRESLGLRKQKSVALALGALVSEHIRTDQREALQQFETFGRQARRPAVVHDLFRFLDWKNSGWPPEDLFLPLYEAVLDAAMPIFPANPPREQVRAVARGGVTALSEDERARYKLDTPLEPALSDALALELKDSHCGMLPQSAIPAMSIAQRYRDAAFAEAMLRAEAEHGAVFLVAGNGHVRTDRAVPWFLRRGAPDRGVVAVMMVEVEEGKVDAASYIPRAPDGRPAADLIVFIPRAERSDPCDTLRQSPPAKK